MEKKDKPRICEVLGVEVEQRFTVDGYCPTVKAFWITADGLFETDPPKFPGTSCAMMVAINHPDRIIRLPRFTQEEMAVLRAVKAAYPWAKYIVRSVAGLYFSERKPTFTKDEYLSSGTAGRFAGLPNKLFLSIQQGKTASLEDFI